MDQEKYIYFDQLTKSYLEGSDRRIVLQSATAAFRRGEFSAILGRSGTGKSTLLNLVSGIDEPDSGQIWLDGQNIHQMNDHQKTLFRREKIGFIFQFFNLIPTLTVWENVCLPLDLNLEPNGSADRYQRAADLLKEVGLLHRKETYPDRLSGGEQQRVAVARALVHNPKVVLADEPTGNLDEENGLRVLELLDRLTRMESKNLLLVTHSRRAADRADSILVLKDGKLEPAPDR